MFPIYIQETIVNLKTVFKQTENDKDKYEEFYQILKTYLDICEEKNFDDYILNVFWEINDNTNIGFLQELDTVCEKVKKLYVKINYYDEFWKENKLDVNELFQISKEDKRSKMKLSTNQMFIQLQLLSNQLMQNMIQIVGNKQDKEMNDGNNSLQNQIMHTCKQNDKQQIMIQQMLVQFQNILQFYKNTSSQTFKPKMDNSKLATKVLRIQKKIHKLLQIDLVKYIQQFVEYKNEIQFLNSSLKRQFRKLQVRKLPMLKEQLSSLSSQNSFSISNSFIDSEKQTQETKCQNMMIMSQTRHDDLEKRLRKSLILIEKAQDIHQNNQQFSEQLKEENQFVQSALNFIDDKINLEQIQEKTEQSITILNESNDKQRTKQVKKKVKNKSKKDKKLKNENCQLCRVY